MWKERTLTNALHSVMRTFPAIVLTGPRQSGKTSLLRRLFSKTHRFASLENPVTRKMANKDPERFFTVYPPPVIIDEIQYAPDLLSYIKEFIDEKRKPGQWLLTGSQHFVLMKGVSQSLAGRAAIMTLLPFSYGEQTGSGKKMADVTSWLKLLGREETIRKTIPSRMTIEEYLFRGNFPEVASQKKIDLERWCGSYIDTYLERDVRDLTQVGDLKLFETFLTLCAARTGQLFHLSEVARDAGISVSTAKRWLSILETGYQVFRLMPYYHNIGKRLVKMPKLYFVDTALAAALLELREKEILLKSPYFGALFETMVVNDIRKRFFHAEGRPSMYYLRTRDGLEIDLLLDWNGKKHLFEIKGSMTITDQHAASLVKMKEYFKSEAGTVALITAAHRNTFAKGIPAYSWKNALAL